MIVFIINHFKVRVKKKFRKKKKEKRNPYVSVRSV